ncbi:hypothetical protein VTK73DRAFT_7022 [Phialemonium thermophilum]|uniref:Myocyte-specific enhancer factor 2d n=1 Tax=Phialemonium thermophilum TaxID=223376 RepID=A0ABR3XTR4_9PEZI
MNREIPGYYYDVDKNRYFKIEASKTAPSNAPWSADNVKRRKLADQEAEAARKRIEKSRTLIRRSKALTEPLTGGFLHRELGRVGPEVPVLAWVRGVREKGKVSLSPLQNAPQANISLLYIGNHDRKRGYGVAYGTLDEQTLLGCYIPRDSRDRIDNSRIDSYRFGGLIPRTEEAIRCLQMSSLRYHQPTHKMLLTSRAPGSTVGISYFSPGLSDPLSDEPEWLIGASDFFIQTALQTPNPECVANTCTPAPASSDLICVIGTSHGIMQFHKDESLRWTVPASHIGAGHGRRSSRIRPGTGSVFTLDFQPGNHHVVFAGGRSDRLSIADLRTPPEQWESIRHRSSVAHVRALNDRQILAAGPYNAMALYDIRFCKPRSSSRLGPAAISRSHAPLISFPTFRNEAHLHFGFDVEPSLGIVAAANDNMRVGLYSLNSGRKLACPPVDAIIGRRMIKALAFQTLPRDVNPSLFMGVGPELVKYSFGVRDIEKGPGGATISDEE